MPTWKPPTLKQPEKGYRFSVDAFLLAAFAARFKPGLFLDLGTGSGPVASHMLSLLPESRCVAVERQPGLATYARMNLCSERSFLLVGDLRLVPWRSQCFDAIVCNPPYFEQGRGKLAQHSQRMAARHALHGSLLDFANCLGSALKPEGVFCYVYPMLDFERMSKRLAASGWRHCHVLEVASFPGERAKLVCAAMRRARCAEICNQSLTLYDAHRVYSDQAMQFLTELHDF